MIAGRFLSASAALFLLALAVLPFNNIPVYHKLLGELSGEASVYPMLLSSFFCLAAFIASREKPPYFPGLGWWGLFLLWIVVGGLVNFGGILSAETQGRSGSEKFVLQSLVVFSGILFGYTAYILAASRRFGVLLARAMLAGIFLTVGYALLEVVYLFGLSDGKLLSTLNGLIRGDPGLYYRVRSVCTESSWFAIYMGLAFPFLYAKILFSSRVRPALLAVFVLCLPIFMLMLSRTADGILILTVGTVTAVAGLSQDKRVRKRAAVLMGASILIYGMTRGIVSNMSGGEASGDRIVAQIRSGPPRQSNNTRYHGMLAALKLGADNPFFGTGIAQYAFRAGDYVDKAAVAANPELREYWREGRSWPVSYVIYARLFAETGIPGVLIWLGCLFLPAIAVISRLREGGEWAAGTVLLALTVNAAFTGLSQDSFRYLGFWLVPALSYAYASGRLQGILYD